MKPTRRSIVFAALSLLLFSYAAFAEQPVAQEMAEDLKSDDWAFVSFPDFFNFDVPNPWPRWDPAVDWFLNQVELEEPEFVLVAGDMVNGHRWDGRTTIEQMSSLYYEGWKRRLAKHGLKYYVAIGDHELGDDPWPKEKFQLVPYFEQAFADHFDMPQNGPFAKKGLAYYVKHKGALFITLETFESKGDSLHATVTGEQLNWLIDVLAKYSEVKYTIVQGHVPIFGDIKSRSSSRIMLEDGKESALWQALVEGGVDLYLCGEFHDVTVLESEGIWQIVHGSSWGREVVDTQNYLVGRMESGTLSLEMKQFPMRVGGDHMWNLHKQRGPREIVTIPESAKRIGPQTIGTLTIEKNGGKKRYTNRTGIFE
ncbi:MAG: metallophosphoesterase [Candidatus Marinimicrobia bacterium]|nr:metallophosphoesterase [Candidatus Neomarinimicrobiota bacterium]MCF7829803.1 metallophosphoesterase [Candidatus Neomarinimicrobiota bacterium]MCF7881764.1 metallophosphoesterase [Candidatus Neomarinimicrobiota bacterium]